MRFFFTAADLGESGDVSYSSVMNVQEKMC